MSNAPKYLARRAAALVALAAVLEVLALAVDVDHFTGLHLLAAAAMWGAVLLGARAYETTGPTPRTVRDL